MLGLKGRRSPTPTPQSAICNPHSALRTSHSWAYLSRTAVVLIALAGLNTLLGYGRDILLAAWYGASPQTDAFFVGSYVPLLVQQLVIVGSLVPAFLPVLAQTSTPSPDGDAERRRLVRDMSLVASGIGLLLAAALWLAAPTVVGLVAPGLAPASAGLAASVLRLSLPMVLFIAPSGVLSAALNYQGRFIAPALAAAATNAFVVLSLAVSGPANGITAAAIGMSIGGLCGLLVAGRQWSAVSGQPSAVSGSHSALRTPHSAIKRVFALAVPLLAMVGLAQFVGVVERQIGSRLGPGSLSLLAYAMKLNLLPVMILAGTVSTVLFPRLAREEQAEEFSRSLGRGISQVLTWTVPASAWLLVCADPALRLLYQHGVFTEADGRQSARILAAYAVGIVPFALLQVLPRAYHARQDMLRPLGLYALGVGAYLGLAPALSAAWGAVGLAAAFSAYNYCSLGLFVWGLRGHLRAQAGVILGTLGRSVAAGLFMAAVCFGLQAALPGLADGGLIGRAALVALLGIGGLGAYAASMALTAGGRLPRTRRHRDLQETSDATLPGP